MPIQKLGSSAFEAEGPTQARKLGPKVQFPSLLSSGSCFGPIGFVSPKITPKSHFFIHLLVGGFNLCFMVLIYYCSIVLERHREMGKKPQNLRKKGQRSKGYGRQMATLIDMVSLYDKFKSFRRSVI